jgi:uncharacterized protein (TIGR02391 family)
MSNLDSVQAVSSRCQALAMRWDDLQLLRLIDDLEERGDVGPLWNGLGLLQKASEGKQITWGVDERPFAQELLLAHDAGYLIWVHRGMTVGPDPGGNAHSWLQEVNEIRLTIAGRDRARGRVVLIALPDPDEDDGRIIAGLTLEEIARALGETYTGNQLPRLLKDSGLPPAFVPEKVEGSKWSWVFSVFDNMHEGGSEARRALRTFIGGWLEGFYSMPPSPDVKKRVVALLGQEGWHVRDGRLVVGEKTFDAAGLLTPLGRDVRLAALHASVREAASRYVDGHLEVAIFEAFKAVNNRVKAMTGLDLDGAKLIGQVFSDSQPLIVFADRSTQTGRDVQAGLRFLFMGAVQAIRNPDAHEAFRPLDQEEGMEALAFASMLMRRLDEATVVQLP